MTDEAISEYNKTIKINSDNALPHLNLGVVYGEKGMNSLSADHFYIAGFLFLKQGDRESALKIYEGLKLIKSKKLEEALYKQLYPDIK
jgi:tetratricopeptide (TPR) repeat protein